MENSSFERRIFPRFNLSLLLKLRGMDFQLATETKNLSCSGIYCQINRFIPVMTKLELTMFVPLIVNKCKIEKKIDCTAVVVRIEPEQEQILASNYNIGLFFTQLQYKDRDLILQYAMQAFFASNN